MIGTFELKLTASQPQKPLPPVFSFQGSPQSLRLIDVPKSIGNWQITKVKVSALYPNNQTIVKEATRTGSVWVATFDGCETAGKVTQGLTILADGIDEGNEPVENYKLGKADIYVLADENDIRRMVSGSTLVYRDDIPAQPSKGDVLVVGEELKIYNGEEWITISGGNEDVYTKEEIDEMVGEISSSISALDSSISALDSSLSILTASVSAFGEDLGVVTASVSSLDLSVTTLGSSMTTLGSSVADLNTSVSGLTSSFASMASSMTELDRSITSLDSSITVIESSVTELASSMTELESTVSELDDLAVKYEDDEKVSVVLNPSGRNCFLRINDGFGVGNAGLRFAGTANYITRNEIKIGIPNNDETPQQVGPTQVQFGGAQNDADLQLGANVHILSFTEEGRSGIYIDDERMLIPTPETVEEGQTIKAVKVYDTPQASRSANLTKRDGETQDWHWEYESANLPSKTSDLTNDAGFVNASQVATFRTWND